MEDYKFWKLLLAQWSWNNDKWCLLLCTGSAIIQVLVYHVSGSILVTPAEQYWEGMRALLVGIIVLMVLFYQVVKLLFFTLFCSCTVYLCRKGDSEAISIYHEALTWRK